MSNTVGGSGVGLFAMLLLLPPWLLWPAAPPQAAETTTMAADGDGESPLSGDGGGLGDDADNACGSGLVAELLLVVVVGGAGMAYT